MKSWNIIGSKYIIWLQLIEMMNDVFDTSNKIHIFYIKLLVCLILKAEKIPMHLICLFIYEMLGFM